MSQNYSRSLLRISVAQICQNLGWNSAQSSSLEVLTDVLERYLMQLGGICHRYSEQFGRTQPNLDDLGLAFKHMGINIGELEDYVKHVDPVPFAHDVIAFPARKPANLGFPNPRSREILQQREEHVDDHLPYMYPNMKDEVPEEKPKSPVVTMETAVLKDEPGIDDSAKNGEVIGEKRSLNISATEGPPIKRQRVGNSCFPDEAGHSQYEMTCVFMGPNGVLTMRPGCQGKLPEPRLPPPNPRNISENNKENKNKEASSGQKGSNGIGGIGVDGINIKKLSKKALMKKNLHDKASKVAIEATGKEIGKKSASSKAAAKFIKKLKTSKKSAKLFGKSKSKDKESKSHNNHGDGGLKGADGEPLPKAGKKKRKEKKSVAILDSDEELRNLSSPSSSPRDPTPMHMSGEDGEKIKARMEAIDDSINSVLRDGVDCSGKVKKKKKKEGKQGENSVKAEATAGSKGDDKGKDKAKKQKANKPSRKNSKDKKPEPPPIDIKPFVSEKYSSEELQVYEFNDSPPDANSVKSRRPSAPDTSLSPHQPAPHPPASKTSSSSHSHPHTHHKVKHIIEPEEELFAPEIKIESRVDKTVKPLKLDFNKEKDKDKHKSKGDKKEKGEEDKHKAKDVKGVKSKEKKEKVKDEDKSKDKHKDKDIKKEKKDKKKDKEKKKKHKEKDRDREKEKEKKREEKIKQEARESRESSPVIGMGVKLKIKMGGRTGPTSSMMVTGENSSPERSSPAPPASTKRESMSPPKVPRLFISKKGQEEKSKKSSKHSNKEKGSQVKSRSSSPSSNVPSPAKSRDRTPPSKNPSPVPPRKTPTPPPPAHSPSPTPQPKDLPGTKDVSESKTSKSVKNKPVKNKPGRLSRKDKSKKKEPKSASVSPVPPKSSTKARETPPRLSHRSSSPEPSPPPLPPQSPPAKPRRSPSPSPVSPHHSPTPPPSLSKRKITPPPSLSPATSRAGSGSTSRKQSQRAASLSPSKPPTPGSTSPAASPEWNFPVSPSRPSPTPPPRTPRASPRHATSPFHSSPPRTPNIDRSPSPALPQSPQEAPRLIDTPELKSVKEYPSPASSGKSSSSGAKNRTVEAETVCVFIDDSGQKVWICPACKLPDDGSEMIGCDSCDNWYHWVCVNITQAPPEEQQWFCKPCLVKNKSAAKGTRGRGRPRGRGRGRGRKKIT